MSASPYILGPATGRERVGYGMAAIAILIVELLIALFVRDRFVRPYLGDVLAVLLVYLALRAATPLTVASAAAAALIIAFAIELGQLLGLLRAIGLEGSTVARMVFGSGFDLRDLIAYMAGGVLALAGEFLFRRYLVTVVRR